MSNSQSTIDENRSRFFAVVAARAADAKKAINPLVLDVGDLLSITEAFVIVSASNSRLVASIAEEVEKEVKKAGGPGPKRIEGRQDASWILMDYGDFVVHVFLEETRDFYNLEKLWADCPRIDWQAADQAKVVND